MTKEELKDWYFWYRQVKNGYHMERNDWQALIRLNHLVMEAANGIHNENMLTKHV